MIRTLQKLLEAPLCAVQGRGKLQKSHCPFLKAIGWVLVSSLLLREVQGGGPPEIRRLQGQTIVSGEAGALLRPLL